MPRYRLIFDGQIQPQTSMTDVRQRLADLFQVKPDQIEDLFGNPPVVLKEDLAYEEALQDKASFEATGALCRLEPQAAAVHHDQGESRNPPGHTARQKGKENRRAGRRFGLYHPYVMAFFSRAFYADVAAYWRGLSFVHLLLVLLLSATAYTVHFQRLIALFVTEEAPAIIEQIPEITIKSGTVRVEVEEPYIIRQPDSGQVFAVIDTTGEVTSLAQTEAVMLLTASRLAVRLSAEDTRIIDLGPIASLEVNRATVSQWLLDIQKWSPFILFPVALGFSFIFRSIQALLYGGLGLALAAMQKAPLPYGAAVSVAIMAMTPVLMLDALLMLMDIYLPLWGLGGFLLAMGYLVFGIRSAAQRAVLSSNRQGEP